MLLYRAINLNDLNDLKNNQDIKCSLIRTHEQKSRKSHQTYFDLCIKGRREFALDILAGHVAGGRLRVGLSSWISTTKDFSFACSEYAIPQAGAYNEAGMRKPIIIIEKDDILHEIEDVKSLRQNTVKEDIVIDVSNGNLNKFYGKAFMSEAFNEKMPGYKQKKLINYELNPNGYNVRGLSNYAFHAQEVVFFKQIRNKDVKCIIYPMLQDILYGCRIDMDRSYKFLIEHIDEMNAFLSNIENICSGIDKTFLKILYPTYKEGNNLTDYLYKNYDSIDGSNIYEKYEYLKKCKRELLEQVVAEFGRFFNGEQTLFRIVDDEVLVLDFNNPSQITDKQINDLLIIEKDEELYKYVPDKKQYVYEKNIICKNQIRELIKQKG